MVNAKENKHYFYPIILKNANFTSYAINCNILIRKIRDEEKKEFFGIEHVDFTFGSNCETYIQHVIISRITPASAKIRGRCSYHELMRRGRYDGINEILASNYVMDITVDVIFPQKSGHNEELVVG